MVQNSTFWKVKECDKTPLGNLKKEKSHFSSYLCFILESSKFFCAGSTGVFYTMSPPAAKSLLTAPTNTVSVIYFYYLPVHPTLHDRRLMAALCRGGGDIPQHRH